MIHQNSFNTFKINAWPKSQASHLLYFQHPRVKYGLNSILNFLANALNETNRAFVTYPTFSLVNVTSFIAGLSFGYQHPPHPSVRSNITPLNCTFSFGFENKYNEKLEPKFIKRRTPYAKIWGATLGTSQSFMTVNVPIEVMREAELRIPNLQEMAWLYMAIGAFTKNFSERHDFWRPGDDLFLTKSTNHEIAYSRYFHKPIPFMFKNVSWDKWLYSKEMWERAPNIFSVRSFNEDATDYYCRYLAKDFYKRLDIKTAKIMEEKAFTFIRSGILDILSKETHTSRYIDTVNSITGHTFIQDTINVEETAEKILTGNL